MDTWESAHALATVRQEASQMRQAVVLLRGHPIGPGWTGATRREAEAAIEHTGDTLLQALGALEHAEYAARQAWTDSLHSPFLTG
jgi:hypothetical protein